jgi:hypothetical protein
VFAIGLGCSGMSAEYGLPDDEALGVYRVVDSMDQLILSGTSSYTALARCARLSGRSERRILMLLTFMVIISCLCAGVILHHNAVMTPCEQRDVP